MIALFVVVFRYVLRPVRPLLDELEEGGTWALGGDELPVSVDFVVGKQLLELDALLH